MSEIPADERQVYESLFGHKLRNDQRVIIQVADVPAPNAEASEQPKCVDVTSIDDWAIFSDLSDEEIAELDALILDRSPGRDIEI